MNSRSLEHSNHRSWCRRKEWVRDLVTGWALICTRTHNINGVGGKSESEALSLTGLSYEHAPTLPGVGGKSEPEMWSLAGLYEYTPQYPSPTDHKTDSSATTWWHMWIHTPTVETATGVVGLATLAGSALLIWAHFILEHSSGITSFCETS